MLKPIRKKEPNGIIKEFKKSINNFKNQSININLKTIQFESLNKINDLSGLPTKNTTNRIVTKKAINTFDFILAILESEDIEELTLTSYRIGKKTVNMLDELLKLNKINKIIILISYNFPRFAPDVWNNLQTLKRTKIKLEDNHTKILLIRTKENNYVIEGSGNLSVNARIEQYCFSNNKEVYEFHYNWIRKI